ncbi:MAG: multiheme c-type cytochrome [Planctomycetaceae bacterium]
MTMTFVFLLATVLAPSAEPSLSRSESHLSLGMNSCTASACHGGPAGVKGKEWNSSYTVWATKDPHADAYAALLSDRSRKIVARLTRVDFVASESDLNKDVQYQAFLEQRCLACHATVTKSQHSTVTKNLASKDGFAEDGVSCSSCHGVAGEWLGNTHAGRLGKSSTAMTNTKVLVPRAEVCVGCHVGSPIHEGQPRRDVDHDLIAAGHPRLNFEFSAYLSVLPAHWDVEKDRQRIREPSDPKKTPGNFAAESWVTGQFVAANAALDLLESRAVANVWPEFSEISCYSCHHDLRWPSFRQKLFDRDPPLSRQSPIGSFVWGTWYPPMARRYLLTADAGAANDEPTWIALGKEMNTVQPDSKKVKPLTSLLRQNLKPPANGQNRVQILSKSVAARPASRRDWDEVAQWFLAATAWHRALQEEAAAIQPAVDQVKRTQRDQALRECEATLEKLRGQLESPHQFDPTGEAFQQAVDQLLQQLATLEG